MLKTLRISALFDGVITIEAMTMFARCVPSPTRMLRRLAAAAVPPTRCVLVEDTLVHLKAARSVGMRSIWMQRYLGGRFRGSLRDGPNAGRKAMENTRRECPKPPYLYARISALRQLRALL